MTSQKIDYSKPLNDPESGNSFINGHSTFYLEQAAILQNAADQDDPGHLPGWREWVLQNPKLAIAARNAILREATKILEKKS
jgi:hypothetical protein